MGDISSGYDSPEQQQKAEREAILAPLRAEFRHIRWWHLDGFGLVVVRRMRKTEALAFTQKTHVASKTYDASGDPHGMVDCNESAVKTCCVWPKDRDSLKHAFDEYPNFSGEAALAISQMADEGITAGGKD